MYYVKMIEQIVTQSALHSTAFSGDLFNSTGSLSRMLTLQLGPPLFSTTHSLFHSRLKTFLFCKSFSLQPFFFFFRTDYTIPQTFIVASSISFLIISFCFVLQCVGLVVVAVR